MEDKQRIRDVKWSERASGALCTKELVFTVVRKYCVFYLSKRLRRQGQNQGAFTNTKVSLVSVLKNATFLN